MTHSKVDSNRDIQTFKGMDPVLGWFRLCDLMRNSSMSRQDYVDLF